MNSPSLDVEALGADPRRLVSLDAVHNFRDLGGYPTADGRVTRWGMIYRADGLYRLTGTDLEEVRRRGVRTVIDLRTAREIDERGKFPVEQFDVNFHHLPVMDSTWASEDIAVERSAVDFLDWAYHDMLDNGAERFAHAITLLAEPGALPAVFHCAAGKDRTGVVAALLLTALGVPREVVLHDYELTTAAMVRMMEWARREEPDLVERFNVAPIAFTNALPEAMERVLASLDAQYGSVQEFLASHGVGAATVQAIADVFLAEPE